MMIEIQPAQLDGIVRAWLSDAIECLGYKIDFNYPHPDDAKQYKKDIKAMKRILDYIGDD